SFGQLVNWSIGTCCSQMKLLTLKKVQRLSRQVLSESNTNKTKVRDGLQQIEQLQSTMSKRARRWFQQLMAELIVDSTQSKPQFDVPLNDQPFWFREMTRSLYKFQSQPELPKCADVVIIGAGLSGASAAYHL